MVELTDPASVEHTPQPRATESLTGLRVMVVDDHAGNLRLTRVFLEELGVTVISCTSGRQAVEAFGEQPLDLVFMDIQMPEMDGLETTRRIRAREGEGPHTPIIALTAHALSSERRALLAEGMVDYLTKPVTEDQLRHMLEKWALRDGHTSPRHASEPVTDGADDSAAVLDPALALRRCGNRPELATDMHQMLLDSLRDDTPEIRALQYNGDRQALLEAVHKLHGATRYCGTPRLETATGQVEEAIKTDADEMTLERTLETLYHEIDQVMDQDPSTIAKAST
jgi:two-component system sensor histidine kinase BarA